MSTPKRTQILLSLKTILEGIKKVDGYNFDVKQVSLDFKGIDQIPRDGFPAIFLQSGASEYAILTGSEYTTGRNISSLDGWRIGIVSYLKEEELKGSFTELGELLNQDIINCLFLDSQLGLPDFVINTYLDMIYEPIPNIGDSGQTTHLINQMVVKVKYDFQKGNF